MAFALLRLHESQTNAKFVQALFLLDGSALGHKSSLERDDGNSMVPWSFSCMATVVVASGSFHRQKQAVQLVRTLPAHHLDTVAWVLE